MPVSLVNLGADCGQVAIRHNEKIWGVGAIIFIHGLGDSRQCFLEAFDTKALNDFNLFAPDLPGFGNSHGGDDLALSGQVRCIEAIIEHFELKEVVLVGHGLGADIAAYVATRSQWAVRVKGLLCVEGTLGEANLEYARMALKAFENPRRTYSKWFRKEFSEETILQLRVERGDSYRRYYESLTLCKPGAFLRMSREMEKNLTVSKDDQKSQAMVAYINCDKPKYFVYGENGFSAAAIDELEKADAPVLRFTGAGHWVMVDQAIPFYRFVLEFSDKLLPRPTGAKRMRLWFGKRLQAWLKKLPGPLRGLKWIKDKIRKHFKY